MYCDILCRIWAICADFSDKAIYFFKNPSYKTVFYIAKDGILYYNGYNNRIILSENKNLGERGIFI